MNVANALVSLSNQGKPLMLGYDHLQSRWVFRMEGKEIKGPILKEVVREAHRDLHAA
jgi:hypothetical protein